MYFYTKYHKLITLKKIVLFVLFTGLLLSCSKKLIPNSKGPNSLIGVINNEIKNNHFSSNAPIYFNGQLIVIEELTLLNEFKLKDFTSIDFLNKKEATKKYGSKGKYGAVIVIPFIDETLSEKYYCAITNNVILAKIAELTKKGIIKSNPILVVNGIPLRGEEIATTINKLGEKGIKQINLLKKISAYEIYGIRAINGVLLIDTNI
jgi:hypothetical protein